MLNRNKHGESGITLIASNCEIPQGIFISDQMQISGIVKGISTLRLAQRPSSPSVTKG